MDKNEYSILAKVDTNYITKLAMNSGLHPWSWYNIDPWENLKEVEIQTKKLQEMGYNV